MNFLELASKVRCRLGILHRIQSFLGKSVALCRQGLFPSLTVLLSSMCWHLCITSVSPGIKSAQNYLNLPWWDRSTRSVALTSQAGCWSLVYPIYSPTLLPLLSQSSDHPQQLQDAQVLQESKPLLVKLPESNVTSHLNLYPSTLMPHFSHLWTHHPEAVLPYSSLWLQASISPPPIVILRSNPWSLLPPVMFPNSTFLLPSLYFSPFFLLIHSLDVCFTVGSTLFFNECHSCKEKTKSKKRLNNKRVVFLR